MVRCWRTDLVGGDGNAPAGAGVLVVCRPDVCDGFRALLSYPPAAMPGDDLLFHRLSDSTIGAVGFHGRVRDGIGWDTDAIATRQWSGRMRKVGLGVPPLVYCDGFLKIDAPCVKVYSGVRRRSSTPSMPCWCDPVLSLMV